jgi:antitoxin component YwqK of YwqJK toxin-antitoxin module
MTLAYILTFAIKHGACDAQLNKFKELLEAGDELSAWQTVQGNIRWLKGENNLRITHKEVYDKSGGIGKTWHENGKLEEKSCYNEKGIREGLYQSWHDNGQLGQQCTFNSEGRREGLYQSWHPNGRLSQQCTFDSKGRKEGLYQSWGSNGELWMECWW